LSSDSSEEDIHNEYIKKLSELTKVQESGLKAVKHYNYVLGNFRDSVKKVERDKPELKETIAKIRDEMTDARTKLKELEAELPVQDNGFYLSLILGKNLNLSLLSKSDKYRYKQDYEAFKWRVTIAIIVVVLLSFLFPVRLMDSIGNFLMVWYYCTLTIRENILTINGSRKVLIKGWWVMHHYLSCVLCGMVLTWRDGECYQSFRQQFLLFVFYISFHGLSQNWKTLNTQMNNYKVELSNFFQLYNAYTLWYLSYNCAGQWQVFALCCMFFILAVGNIVTTSMVILKKFRTSGSYNYIVGLTRKYRTRLDEKEE
uniref:TMPIT-like protein n=1 Tax=Angiostrongylus cantonensis TaxID=6313 RepID=A0A158PB10_ANGCA